MVIKKINLAVLTHIWICLLNFTWTIGVKAEPAIEDYCMLETFKPRCPRNEVIIMKSATYGRMRIGRCITAEEADALGPRFGEDPRYIGCSADVLPLLDRKCSGKAECEVRWSDISVENIKPCFPGLTVYFEVNYECIRIVDGDRSCTVTATKTPAYFLNASTSQRICGTKSQPWIVETPVGQKINISLFDFTTSNFVSSQGKSKQHCPSHGLIIDKPGKRNITICVAGERRQKELYLSAGNVVRIVFDAHIQQEKVDTVVQFMLKVEAVGCSDIVPPEDAWLKRNDDTILIGCYSSRQTWRLSCNGGNWIGVLGNCSKEKDYAVQISNTESENESTMMNDKQVLVIVVMSGITLTVCLVIVCSGAVYLRRFYVQFQKKQEYKTLNFRTSTFRSQPSGQRMPVNVATFDNGTDTNFAPIPQMPTYSMYAGQGDLVHVDNVVSPEN